MLQKKYYSNSNILICNISILKYLCKKKKLKNGGLVIFNFSSLYEFNFKNGYLYSNKDMLRYRKLSINLIFYFFLLLFIHFSQGEKVTLMVSWGQNDPRSAVSSKWLALSTAFSLSSVGSLITRSY